MRLGFTEAQHEQRRKGIGGSDANIIARGDPEALNRLARQKRGLEPPESLEDELPVMMGSFTEPLNRHWFKKETGWPVIDPGSFHIHKDIPWMRATIDGRTFAYEQPALFEAKHVNAFVKVDEVVQSYMPQLHHNMHVIGVNIACLSIFIGTMRYECITVEKDEFFMADLLKREQAFWTCVEMGLAPSGMDSLYAEPKIVGEGRTVDMTGNNEWASVAFDWLNNEEAAKKFDKACLQIKGKKGKSIGLFTPDMGKAFGHGIVVRRDKRGIRIERQSDD